jgi:copper(I)-binding protein
MTTARTLFATILALALALAAFLPLSAHADMKIETPHSFETSEGVKVGAAFMLLTNTDKEADRLVAATSPVCGRVEIHEMADENGVMKMRQVSSLEIPAEASVELKPHSYHLMLMDLPSPLKAGSKFPLTLSFEKAGDVDVMVDVGARAAPTPVAPMDHETMDHGNMGHMDHPKE